MDKPSVCLLESIMNTADFYKSNISLVKVDKVIIKKILIEYYKTCMNN